MRRIPWLIAVIGLVVPLIVTGFVIWPAVLFWAAVLASLRAFGWMVGPPAWARMGCAFFSLPLLFILAWWGGWCLIPAAIASFVVDLFHRGPSKQPAPLPTPAVTQPSNVPTPAATQPSNVPTPAVKQPAADAGQVPTPAVKQPAADAGQVPGGSLAAAAVAARQVRPGA